MKPPIYAQLYFQSTAARPGPIRDGYRRVVIYYIGSKWANILDPFTLDVGRYSAARVHTMLSQGTIIHDADHDNMMWMAVLSIITGNVKAVNRQNKAAALIGERQQSIRAGVQHALTTIRLAKGL